MKLHQMRLSGMILLGLVVVFFLISTSVLYAQSGKLTFTNKSRVDKSKIQQLPQPSASATAKKIKLLPDMTITSAKWSNLIRSGDTLGTSSILNITVKNQGIGVAEDCKMMIVCESLSGANSPVAMTGTRSVFQLNPGKSQAYPWPHGTSEKWGPGKYRLTILVDSSKQVAESNEANNKRQITFTVHPKVNLQQAKPDVAIAQKPGASAASIMMDIPVQSPPAGSKQKVGDLLKVKWIQGEISSYSSVNIQLVDAQSRKVEETIKTGAPNNGLYSGWKVPPAKYSWPGSTYKIKVFTSDNRYCGYSGAFTMPAKQKKPFSLDTVLITNGWAHERTHGSSNDCLFAPNVQGGRQPGANEAKIGHFHKHGKHGDCNYADKYFFRSRLYFDQNFLKGKAIVEATLMITLADTFEMAPGTNAQLSSKCDIYLLNSSWPASPQPMNFNPGPYLKSFSLFGPGETASIDLPYVDGTLGPIKGLMLRGPLNHIQYTPSACIKYYKNIKLVGYYMD